VIVPESGTRGRPYLDAEHYDRLKGLCVRPRGEDGALVETSGAQGVLAALVSRQHAELARLFYVAATRARDLLVFSGEVSRGGGAWRDHLEGFASVAGASKLMKVVDAVPAPFVQVDDEKGAGERGAPVASPIRPAVSQERLVAQTQGPRLSVRSLVAPVTQLADFSLCPRRHHFAHALGIEERPARTQREQERQPERSRMGAAERGTFVHRVLERIDFGAPASGQVRALLASEGRPGDGAEAASLIDDVSAFAESPLGRQLARLPASRLLRELPFLLAVGEEDVTLHVRGAVDVLAVLEDGTALVLDYKHTAASGRGADDYAFQLACYALAMRGFLPRGVTLCAGIAFLKDRGAPPDVRTLSDAALSTFERTLAVMGKELLERQRTQDWPVLSRPRCEAMRCGFVYLCHRSPLECGTPAPL
jgi:ATP-dependent exoDNAse (exonuclease V) beta subunit